MQLIIDRDLDCKWKYALDTIRNSRGSHLVLFVAMSALTHLILSDKSLVDMINEARSKDFYQYISQPSISLLS